MNELSREIYRRVGIANHEAAERMLTAWMADSVFGLAHQLWCQGYSIIPLSADGKRPVRKWKRFQTEQCTLAELIEWFIDHDFAPAIVTGKLSGITVIDCDNSEAADYWFRYGGDWYAEQSTKRGRHYVHRWAGERNTVDLHAIAGIDRRGEGGYVKAYPQSMNWPTANPLPLRS